MSAPTNASRWERDDTGYWCQCGNPIAGPDATHLPEHCRKCDPIKVAIMACSGKKRPGERPAIEKYDGPMWQTLRARLAELPAAAEAFASGKLRIMVLSAKFGFIDAAVAVPDYDQRLDERRATELLRDNSYDLQMLPGMVDQAEAVLFAGGELYRNTMWKATGANLWNIMKIDETNGAGIGFQREQLSAWFNQHYGAELARAA